MTTTIPVGRIVDVIGKGKDAADKVAGDLRIDVLVDPEVPRWVALAVKADLTPLQPASRVEVVRLGEQGPVTEGTDVVLVLAGGSEDLVRSAVYAYLGAGVPTVVVAESSLDVPELDVPAELARLYTLVAASEREALDEGLAAWLVGATDKHVTMAANFPFCREVEVRRLVSRCAMENAAVGAVDFLPGADFPIMAGNQIKLAFDIAAAHGKGLALERVPEVLGVVTAGLFYRAITRSLVAHTPVGKFAVRAAMGYAGTVATSAAIRAVNGISEGTFHLPSVEDVTARVRDLSGAGVPGSVHDGSTEEMPVLVRPTPVDDGEDLGYLCYEADGSVR